MEVLQSLPAGLFVALIAVLGLLVGSFLNVVIYRLPKMIEAAWQQECKALLISGDAPHGAAGVPSNGSAEPFNLMWPRSRCGACGHTIRWFENIPVLSWLFLRGKCSACHTPISARYPVVELITGMLFTYIAWRWGASWATLGWLVFMAALLALIFIDWDTTYLPDDITLPLVWLGLLMALAGVNPLVASLSDAVWGAVAGYLILWSIYWIFKFSTGKEGMGYGDFKLLAALGAWFGWQALLPIVLMSSVVGAVVGIALKINANLREGGYMPYGPFLGIAALAVLFVGAPTMMAWMGL